MTEKERILKEILKLLNERYPVGLYEYLFKHRGDLYKQLLDLEDRIDKAFLSGTIDELKAVLRAYWRLHIQAMKEFEQVDQFDLPMARQEMEEERVRV